MQSPMRVYRGLELARRRLAELLAIDPAPSRQQVGRWLRHGVIDRRTGKRVLLRGRAVGNRWLVAEDDLIAFVDAFAGEPAATTPGEEGGNV